MNSVENPQLDLFGRNAPLDGTRRRARPRPRTIDELRSRRWIKRDPWRHLSQRLKHLDLLAWLSPNQAFEQQEIRREMRWRESESRRTGRPLW